MTLWPGLVGMGLALWPLAAPAMPLPFAANGTDQQEALQVAIDDAAAAGRALVLPAGEFLHGGVLVISGTQVSGQGPSTVLRGTTRDASAVVLAGSGSSLKNLRLANPSTARSQHDYSAQVLVKEASRFNVSGLAVSGSDSAGILVRRSTDGVIEKNTLGGTLADSIHITDNSHRITVENNKASGSGDDGIAVVSYEKDGGKSHHIVIRNNTVKNNVGGRGISTVGGDEVLIAGNTITCGAHRSAGIYVASELYWFTYGASNIEVRGNRVENCGLRHDGYDAITVYSNYRSNRNVLVRGNTVKGSPEGGIWLKTFLPRGNVSVTVVSNTVVSATQPAKENR